VPEGHSIHRVALQLGADLAGRRVGASSPQGRFAAGAALLDGRVVTESFAVGKHLLVGFADGGGVRPGGRGATLRFDGGGGARAGAREDARWLRVHLGLYGAWDFHGRVAPIGGQAYGVGSIGAPRLRRAVRIGEQESALPGGGVLGDARSDDARFGGSGGPSGPPRDGDVSGVTDPEAAVVGETPSFPPDPVGQVRLRLASEETVADLRGPSRCEVIDFAGVEALLAAAGPDPRVDY